jgi:hypothetical protein
MMLQATIGGIVFEGAPADPEQAFVIDPDGWAGWDEGVAMRREEVVRPSSHGSFDTPGYLTPRVTTISGWMVAPTAGDLATMRKQLTGLLADGSSGTLTVETAEGETTASVRLAGQTAVKVSGSEREARFQIQFWSPDPRRYGVTHTYGPGSSVSTVEHDGNFPAVAELTVAGSSGGGYTVTGPDSRLITVTTPLVTGHPHTIDMRTGSLVVDGVRVVGGFSVYQPWSVPAGATVTVSVSAGTVTVQVRDTFV